MTRIAAWNPFCHFEMDFWLANTTDLVSGTTWKIIRIKESSCLVQMWIQFLTFQLIKNQFLQLLVMGPFESIVSEKCSAKLFQLLQNTHKKIKMQAFYYISSLDVLGSVAGPVIQATGRSEVEDGLESGYFVSGYSYYMSTTGFPDHTMQTKFQSQRPSDVKTPVPSI
jgi:hypothetical protein